jgi:hypothetical protein
MNRTIASVTTALLMLAPLCPAAFAQGAVQTAGLMSIDPDTVTVGYRATKVVGSDVTDAAGTKLGTVDDLIITSADQVPYAVLSVGGFLGIGEKHVLVRASNLDVVNARIVLAGGTKASLTALPPTFTPSDPDAWRARLLVPPHRHSRRPEWTILTQPSPYSTITAQPRPRSRS